MTFRDSNGNELQFDGEFAITKQSVSIFSGSVKGDVSITFKVDNNSVNREILNYQGPLMTNQVAFTKQPFSRVSKGNIIDRGYIIIQSEDTNHLNCFYVSGNSNWIQKLEGLITELDYSGETNGKNYNVAFDGIYSPGNTLATTTEGIVFPFADWCFAKKKGDEIYFNFDQGRTIVDIENLTTKPLIQIYPCFYLHSLVSEIFNQSQIKKEGNLFNDALYKTMAVPPDEGQIKRQPFKKVLLNGSSQTYSAGVGVYEKIKGLTLRQSDPSTWDDVLKRFMTPIQCVFYIDITMTAGTATNIRLYKNGVPVGGVETITLGIKKRLYPGAALPGDYFELYTTNTGSSPFSASFDLEYEIPEIILYSDYIDPKNFLPEMQSMDIIKFLINFFGCSAYFDSTSNTITITIIEKLKLEDAYDWSEYFVSHKIDYTDNAKHNFISWEKSSDTEIDKYNKLNTLKFGDGDIQTSNTLLDQKQISKLPFAPTSASLCFNKTYALNIPLINLVDEGEPIEFTAIALKSSSDVTARFTTGVTSVLHDFEVVRITNSNGLNIGYYVAEPTGGGATFEDIYFPFESTDTGKIWRQKIVYQKIEPRILTVNSATVSQDFSESVLRLRVFGVGIINIDAASYAAFTKNVTGLPIDRWKNNLAIDNPNSGNFTDPTIKELYFNKISRFIKNPKVRTMMRLPEAVYHRFKFDQFIYLNTEKLTGYFFVESIENYVDSNTPVEVNLYML